MPADPAVMWILLSLLWLLVGIILGFLIRGTRATASLEHRNDQLVELLLAQTPAKGLELARIRDTAAVRELAQHIIDEGGGGWTAAMEEAERMLGQFDAPAQDMSDMVKGELTEL